MLTAPLDHLTIFFNTLCGPDSEQIRDRAHRPASTPRNPHLEHEEEAVDVPVGIIYFGRKARLALNLVLSRLRHHLIRP